MASWLKETTEPLIWGGAVSEMYSGPTMEAMPIPIPATKRKPMSHHTPGDSPMPIAPIRNTAAVTRMIRRLPRGSASLPPTAAPSTAPTSTPLTTSSCRKFESAKSCLMYSKAPEMMPVS
jgi:hypothetical protein